MSVCHDTVAPPGMKGEPGQRGEKGMVGMAGLPGPSAYIMARHSQSSIRPRCPDGSVRLWDGYSLLYTEEDKNSANQDLGKCRSLHTRHSHVLDQVTLMVYNYHLVRHNTFSP